jgi:alanine racemase
MDALMIDVTDCTAEVGDEVVLMGQQGNACVPAEELAAWKGTVVYEILPGWRHRLPRRYLRG